MSDTSAGQPSERVPDFIPGWFRPRHTTAETYEAVRLVADASFPIAFLRSDEFVHPAKPGEHGVRIGRRGSGMGLAVPPGGWIVRGIAGELRNWRDGDFTRHFIRTEASWAAAVTREEAAEWPLPPGEYQAKIVDGAVKTASRDDEPDRPDAEIVDGDGHPLAGLHVVLDQDDVPHLSLIELEHLFANLYEDITERQAKEQRGEATLTGTMAARDGESPTCAVDAIDESEVQREAIRALYDRITDGPVPNAAELARVIAILGGPVGVGR